MTVSFVHNPMETQQYESTPKVDVIIVGAGIAGLTTAMKLLEKESTLQIKILEATGTVGGQLSETFLGEIGAKWITEGQHHIWQLVQKLQVPTTRRALVAPTARRSWDTDGGVWAPLAKYELERYIEAVQLRTCHCQRTRMSKRASGGNSDTATMEAHIRANLFFSQSRSFMRSVVQYVCGAAPQHIGYVEFMRVCSSHGGLRALIQFYFECPESLLEVNSGTLLRALLRRLKPTQLLLWRRVHTLRQHRDHVEVRDSEYQQHTADALVLAVPWESLRDMQLSPKPPFDLAPPAAAHPTLMVTSMLARYAEAHWRRTGHSGSFVRHNVPTLPLLLGHEYRPAVYAAHLLHGPEQIARLQPLAFRLFADQYGAAMLLPNDYSERTFVVPSLAHTPFTSSWLRVVLAHTATSATLCRGALSGAVQGAQRATVNVLLLLRPQTLSWQDIAEIYGEADDADAPHTHARPASWLRLWLSSLNLYNVASYSLLAISVALIMRMTHRRIGPNWR